MAIAGGIALALKAKKGRHPDRIARYKAGYAQGWNDVRKGIIGACPSQQSSEFCRGYDDGQTDARQPG
jgi:hypothetical protein